MRRLPMELLSGIPPEPRRVTKLDVWFDSDADGILTLSAEDVNTGNKNQITVTNQSRLSKEEVDRLLEEAKKYRAENEQYRRKVMAKNALENYANNTWDTLRDYECKLGIKDKNRIEAAIEKTIHWLDWNFQLEEAWKFEEKLKELQDFCEPILARCSTVANSPKVIGRKQFDKWFGISSLFKFLSFWNDESP